MLEGAMVDVQTRTGPSAGACASPQGLPAFQIWLSKSNKCIKTTEKVSPLLTVQVVLPSLPFFCWEGWGVNAEGLFYMCQVLCPWRQVLPSSRTACLQLVPGQMFPSRGSPGPAYHPRLASSSLHPLPPHPRAVLSYQPALLSADSLHQMWCEHMPNGKIPVPNVLDPDLLHSIIQDPELTGPRSLNDNSLITLQQLLRKFPHDKSTAGRPRSAEV